MVNGMGLSDGITAEAIKGLPPPISVAYGAYGRNLQDWVTQARGDGHEVLLQIPLEPPDYPKTDPGPHTLLTTLPPEENIKRLQWLMSRFTGYVGITNHMGAKFEATSDALVPVMEELKARGLLFLDDGTARTAKVETASAAGQIPDELKGPAAERAARALGLDYAIADIQIDAVPGDIAKALARLEALAIQQGSAIGVASAKPDTVKQIAAWAQQLPGKGIVLIPISAAVRSQRQS
ncbi:MAG: divergent polysaccharide deacetylase family protein [Hyphomicrobiales bacterium]|nr:MAG: divergent polysaccharide deacetylase family protein [Hyphomicrobiales bacterium]